MVIRHNWFDNLNIALMLFFSLLVIYPVWNQVVISVSPATEASLPGLHLWTNHATLASYERIFSTSIMGNAFFWSIMRTIVGTVVTLAICFLFAYPLSRKTLWKRNFWMGALVFTMFFSGGLIPSYLVVRDLGMMNTLWSLVLPGALVPFYVLMLRNYIMSLPEELIESAKIDGADDFRILRSVILPLTTPIMATVALWSGVAHWNAWFDAMLYLQNSPIQILQEILRAMLMEAQVNASDPVSAAISQTVALQDFTPNSVRAATLVIITLPIVCTYPFLQKYFVKGVMMGSLKG